MADIARYYFFVNFSEIRQNKTFMKYSIIVPVFNRPDEVDELMESLKRQAFKDFEVIIVEDGSTTPCEEVVRRHEGALDVKYFFKANSGPGSSRNFGAERASGAYLIILDSDIVAPEGYLEACESELRSEPADAFGGPDRAHPSFSDVQKAINYSMTSFFTTGGIRGGKKKMDKFYPRSFNMGVRASLYKALGGFSDMRFGEDIDFSIRIFKSGAKCRLFPEAWVWHKRRTGFRKFFKQVHNSGIARINLYKKYPESLKLVHLMPAAFTVSCITVVIPLLYTLLLFADASIRTRSLKIGLLAVPAAFIQLTGYGTGFIRAWWARCVCGKDEFSAFNRSFYK